MSRAMPGGTASGRRPTTASSRPMSGMRQQVPGTAMRGGAGAGPVPGTGAARPVQGGGVLDSKIMVSDRPVTQQGLGGMKTGPKGPHRMVQDESYYLAQLRTRINELVQENNSLRKEIDHINHENSSYLSYEKIAEGLATEIKELQGELADYNTLVDKLNTDTEMDEVQEDYNQLKVQNDFESKNMDTLFTERQEKEKQINMIEQEIEQCRRLADNLVQDMSPKMKEKYAQLKQTNESMLHTLEVKQQELDSLNTRKLNLENELSTSYVKQEAVRLYEQLHELKDKKNSLLEEERAKGSPAEEREKLLKQVKDDNQEIATMDRQTTELKEKVEKMQDELRQLDMDLEEHQGEKNVKYKELKKREETMDEFLNGFEDTKTQELERKSTVEANVVAILEHMSRNLARSKHMPTPKELNRMRDDLNFKENELHKSQATATGLAAESEKLQMDLQKVEQLENKINLEMETLQTKITQMNEEIEVYSDLDKLRQDGENRKQRLHEEKIVLGKRKDYFKKELQDLSTVYDASKTQLNENETYTQLGNLERKWQHHEQNNFVMKEFIAAKSMESDYRPIVKDIKEMLSTFNKMLQDSASKGTSNY